MAKSKERTASSESDLKSSVEISGPGEVGPKPNLEIVPPPVMPTSGEQTTSGNLDGLNMRSPRFWLAAGAVILILVAILVTISYLVGNKKKPGPNQQQQQPAHRQFPDLSAVDHGAQHPIEIASEAALVCIDEILGRQFEELGPKPGAMLPRKKRFEFRAEHQDGHSAADLSDGGDQWLGG